LEDPILLGTGGALKKADRLLGETFFSVNVDIRTDLDLGALAAAHERLGRPPATMALVDKPDRATVSLDSSGRVIGLRAPGRLPGEAARLCGTGIMVVERKTLSLLPEGPCDVVETLALTIKAIGPAGLVYPVAFWRDMGRLPDYFELNSLLASGRRFWGQPLVPAASGEDPPWSRERVRIEGFLCAEPGAVVRPGAFLKDCVLWREAVIGSGASVEGAVVAGVVPAGAVIRGGVVPGAHRPEVPGQAESC
jgi:mannose-1-phosphate guanylyltransferase